MKHFLQKAFLFLLGGVLCSLSVTAQNTTTVGAEDNTTAYLGAFSEILELTDGQIATFEFTNYSSKEENWNNWVSCVSGETINAGNLLIALRADNWENVQNSNSGISSNFNWETFKDEMDGANVVTTYSYVSGTVTIHCDITAVGGNTYFEEFSKTGFTGPISVAMSVDHSHLNINKAVVNIGAKDNSTPYLGAFSKIYELSDNEMVTFEFTNYSAKTENYQNWVSCVSGETFNAGSLLVALRADNWENVQNSNNGISSNFNWDIFRDEMDGANVVTSFKYQDGKVTIHNDITAKSGNTYFEEFTKGGLSGTITVALSVDGSHLDISKSEKTSLTPKPEGLVGNEDNSTNYMGDFSQELQLTDGQIATFEFTNYSAKGGNSQNWLACVSKGETFSTDADNLLVVLRADNWENIQWANTGITSNYDWDNFTTEMDESSVVTTFKYKDGKVTVRSEITAKSGNTYFEEFTKEGVEGTISVCMSVERAHLLVTKAEVTDIPVKPEGLVGNEDNSTNYMGDFSKELQLTDGQIATFEFTNYSAKEANSQNWLACVSKGESFSTTDENLLVVLRADNWEIKQWANTGITSNYDWDNFATEMDESSVVTTFKYKDGKVTIRSEITAKSGKTYFEEFTKEGVEGTISVCMSVERAHLLVTKAEVTDIPVKPEGQVGETDNSTDRLGDTSEALTFEEGQMATFEFTNYSDKAETWHNWIACVNSGEAIDTENPLVLLRADNYEEVQAANTGIANNYNWDTFKDDMHESNVVLTIKYKNGRLIMRAKITTADEKEYFEEFVKGGVEGKVTACMSVFLSHLIISKAEVTALPVIPENYVGYEDNTSIYLEETSEVLTLTDGKIATFEFTNYSDKVDNWHNWIVCLGGEYFNLANLAVALRADAWENVQSGNTGITSNFDFATDDMDGAKVVVKVTYKEGKAVIHADITTAAENKYSIEFTKEDLSGTITAAMSIDHAHLVMTKAEVTDDPASGISTIDAQNATQDAPMFDLSGRRVDANYKGIVIQNGKKMIVK